MKIKITLLSLALCSLFKMNSQVVLTEGFTATWTPASASWSVINNSTPVGSTSWFQGNSSNFASYNGGPNDFFAANFNNVNAAGTISNWLITPTVVIYNGAVLEFATRTYDQGAGQPNFKPDRLQVRMCQTNPIPVTIPGGAAGVGPFTDLLLDINPNLNTSTVAAVSNSVVNGYPKEWTTYTVMVTGLSGTVTAGRFAFRYFVNNAGNTQTTNANYIGIDGVKYSLPCTAAATSYTTCANQLVTLSAGGGLASTTYSWAGPGGYTNTSPVITVTAPAAGVASYTLYPSVGGSVSCGNFTTANVTVGGQLSMQVSATSTNVCSGYNVTLTAVSPATSYLWGVSGSGTVGTGPSIVINPTVNATYTVGGTSGTFPALCLGSSNIVINTLPLPTITFTQVGSSCTGSSFSLVAGGGVAYIWAGSNFNVTSGNPLPLQGSSPGPRTFTVLGQGANGCIAGIASGYTVLPTPTVGVVSSQTPACRNGGVELTASGANTYTWSGPSVPTTSTMNPLAYTTTTASGNRTIVVTGMSADGCVGTNTLLLATVICPGIETHPGNGEAAIYPNPFTNELKVTGVTGNVEIYNTLGQVVVKATLRNATETIDTAELPKGAYILKTYNKDGDVVKTVKLLKN